MNERKKMHELRLAQVREANHKKVKRKAYFVGGKKKIKAKGEWRKRK